MKLYIAVLDTFPDFMTPTLVAHAVLGAHLKFQDIDDYKIWLETSFKKCVVRVNNKEFSKIKSSIDTNKVHLAFERNTLDGVDACAVVCPCAPEDLPNVLKFAKLWKPYN